MYCNNIITTITISLFQLIFHRILPILKSKLKVHIYQSKRFGGFNTWEFINFFQEASHISFKVPPPPLRENWSDYLNFGSRNPKHVVFCRSRIKLPKYLRFRLCICLDKSFCYFFSPLHRYIQSLFRIYKWMRRIYFTNNLWRVFNNGSHDESY